MSDEKPRIKVKAGSSGWTADSFQNVVARLGQGTENVAAHGRYGYNPITRNRQQLDWMYRGSWIVGAAVDAPADDMVKAGIKIKGSLGPEDIKNLGASLRKKGVWSALADTIRWSRLYGGAISVIMVEGQELSTELRMPTVGKDQFKGVVVLDRWMVEPTTQDLVGIPGPNFGMPRFYRVVAGSVLAGKLIHYTRVVRFDGVELPFWERQSEMGWGMSVLERIYDRLLGFDSTTQGVAQLVYRAHLRVLKVKDLRSAIAASGPAINGIIKNIEMIRALQTTEGMTVIDSEDDFQALTYAFSGLSDVMLQFAQQLSGALKIPMVRLFGQTPTGLNTNGEGDLRTYYDGINQEQESDLRDPVTRILEIAHMSEFGKPPAEDFDFDFEPLWQLTDQQKVEVAKGTVEAVSSALDGNLIDLATGMKELKQSSEITGIFSNISEDAISQAENEPPMPGELEDGLSSTSPGDLLGDETLEADPRAGVPGPSPADISPGVRQLKLGLDPDTQVTLRAVR